MLEEDDPDDPEEPMMEGSDDEFLGEEARWTPLCTHLMDIQARVC